jgi:hypothetical protein
MVLACRAQQTRVSQCTQNSGRPNVLFLCITFVLLSRISFAIEFPHRVREAREPAVRFGFSWCDAAELAIEANCTSQLFDFDY